MNPNELYPLRFAPLFRRYLWGGRRLATELGKEIGEEKCAESWEIVDRPEDNSVVLFGNHAGITLNELMQRFSVELLGRHVHDQVSDPEMPDRLRGRFPLLLKFLDACQTLSVQVHPDDKAGMAQEVPDLGKTEAWYVMGADPGGRIYSGLKAGIDRPRLTDAIENRKTDSVVHSIEPAVGDCVFVPAGTIHAIGEGLLIAEIQQSSDTTFRIFDWNRIDADGNERALHIQQALDVTNYDLGPVDPQVPKESDDSRCRELVHCDKFFIREWTLQDDTVELVLDDSFRVIMVVGGSIDLAGDPSQVPLQKGQTTLVPACLGAVSVNSTQESRFLEIGVPSRA